MSKEYIKRINVVLDFIEKNLEASLSLKVLSQKAHYSPYHFHRVFSIVVGESINQYVNRKRIERIASILLTNSDQTIKELAYFYGFNSESSFSRAFKKFYGITPTQFKSEGKKLISKIGIELFTTEKYICSIDNLIKWMEMNAQIVVSELQEIKLAGISGIGNFDQVGELYNQLMSWGHEKSVLPHHSFKAITIYHDNPNVTPLSKVRYSACVKINKDIEAEGEIRPLSIQKGIYVVGRFEIKGEEISNAWKNMHVWIVENGYEFRDGDYFEIYHNDHKAHPEQKFIIDICIPIEKTKQVQLGKKNNVNFSHSKPKNLPQKEQTKYFELISFMKELRTFFHKDYDGTFQLGKLYQGNPEFSYFSLTTASFKKQKLKFVIVLDHQEKAFSICLSGQNKSIRKKFWQMFKESNWNKYPLVQSIDNSLFIMDYTIIVNPDFHEKTILTEQIEKGILEFIDELKKVFEQ